MNIERYNLGKRLFDERSILKSFGKSSFFDSSRNRTTQKKLSTVQKLRKIKSDQDDFGVLGNDLAVTDKIIEKAKNRQARIDRCKFMTDHELNLYFKTLSSKNEERERKFWANNQHLRQVRSKKSVIKENKLLKEVETLSTGAFDNSNKKIARPVPKIEESMISDIFSNHEGPVGKSSYFARSKKQRAAKREVKETHKAFNEIKLREKQHKASKKLSADTTKSPIHLETATIDPMFRYPSLSSTIRKKLVNLLIPITEEDEPQDVFIIDEDLSHEYDHIDYTYNNSDSDSSSLNWPSPTSDSYEWVSMESGGDMSTTIDPSVNFPDLPATMYPSFYGCKGEEDYNTSDDEWVSGTANLALRSATSFLDLVDKIREYCTKIYDCMPVIDMITSSVVYAYQLYKSSSVQEMIASTYQYISAQGSRIASKAKDIIQWAFREGFEVFKTYMKKYSTIKLESFSQAFDGVISDIRKVFTSQLCQSIRNLVLGVVGLRFFNKDTAQKVAKFLGKPPKLDFFSLVEYIINSIGAMIKLGEDLFLGAPLSTVFLGKDPVTQTTMDIKDLTYYADKIYLGLPVEGMMCEVEFMSKAKKLLDTSDYLCKHSSKVMTELSELKRVSLILKNHHFEIKTKNNFSTRPIPFCALLHGVPGAGKGRLLDFTMSVHSCVKGREFDPSHVYHRCMTSDYWENVQPESHPYVHYSELGKDAKSIARVKGDKAMQEFNTLVDSQPFPVDMAFADKGKVCIRPEMVIGDTNCPDLNLLDTVRNPAAMKRRILFIEVNVLPEFRVEGGCALDSNKSLAAMNDPNYKGIMDRYTFTCRRFIPKSVVESEEIIVLQDARITEFTDFLIGEFKKHIKNQTEVGEAMKQQQHPNHYTNHFGVPQPIAAQSGKDYYVGKYESYWALFKDRFYLMFHSIWLYCFSFFAVNALKHLPNKPHYKRCAASVFGVIGVTVVFPWLWWLVYVWTPIALTLPFLNAWVPSSATARDAAVEIFNLQKDRTAKRIKRLLYIPCFDGLQTAEVLLGVFSAMITMYAASKGIQVVKSYIFKRRPEEGFKNLEYGDYDAAAFYKPSGDTFVSVKKTEDPFQDAQLQSILSRSNPFIELSKGIDTEDHSFKNSVKPFSEVLNDYEEKAGCHNSYTRIPVKGTELWNAQVDLVPHTAHSGEPEELYDSVVKNKRFVLIVTNEVKNNHILGLRGNYALINTHALGTASEPEIRMFNSGPVTYSNSDFVASKLRPSDRYDLGNDLTVVRLKGIQFRDIVKHIVETLPPQTTYKGCFDNRIVKTILRKGDFSMLLEDVTFTLPYLWCYSYPGHRPGSCGTPLVAKMSVGSCVVGIHVGGRNADEGYANPIDRNSILTALRSLESNTIMFPLGSMGPINVESFEEPIPQSPFRYEYLPGLIYLGKRPGQPNIKQKSRLRRNRGWFERQMKFLKYIKPDKVSIFGIPQMAPIYKPTFCSPYNIALRGMGNQRKSLDSNILERVVEEFTSHILKKLEDLKVPDLSPLTVEAAINGVKNDPFIKRINPTTSAGYGWTGKKGDYIPLDIEGEIDRIPVEELQNRILEIIEHISNGEVPLVVSRAQLKDEARSIEKCKDGRTRVFFIAPIEAIILSRMFLKPFYSLMVEHGAVFGTSVGMNTHSGGDNFRSRLESFGTKTGVWEGDFKSYDQTMPFDVGYAASSVIYRVLEAKGYNSFALMMVAAILTQNLFPVIDMNLDIFIAPGMQVSGKDGTTEDNSIRNVILSMYAYVKEKVPGKYWDNVVPNTNGDDLVMKVSEVIEAFFNAIVFQRCCANDFNMTFTSADKEKPLTAFVSIDDISFLKRMLKYRKDLNKWVMPLDPNSMLRSLTWSIPSVSVNHYDQYKSTLSSCIWEAALHLTEHDHEKFREDMISDAIENDLIADRENIPHYAQIVESIWS